MSTPDLQLLQRWHQSRDAEAFTELATRYENLVYAACRRILGAQAEAEDVAQECFLTLAQRPPLRDRPLGPWLHTVATRRALNQLKAEMRRRSRESHFAEASPQAAEPVWDDLQGFVDEAIDALPDKYRRPIVLHFLERRTHAEVAEALGLPRTTISSQLDRGIREIRGHLRKRGVEIGAAALTALLAANAVEAAPASLAMGLGKLALSGAGTASVMGISAGAGGALALKVAAALLLLSVVTGIGFYASRTPALGTPGIAHQSAQSIATQEPLPGATPPAQAVSPVSTQAAAFASLATAGNLLGRVLNQQGQPVPEANILYGKEGTLLRATTNSDGAIIVDAAPTEDYVLFAYKEDVGIAKKQSIPAGASARDLTLTPLPSISGRLIEAGTNAPLAGLEVRLGTYDSGGRFELADAMRAFKVLNQLPKTTSGADGSYLLRNLLPGKYLFEPPDPANDYVYPGMNGPHKDISVQAEEAVQHVDLVLERGGSLRGTVLDGRGQPLAGAKLWIGSSRHSFFDVQELKTAIDGHFLFRGLPAGADYVIGARHKDFADTSSEKLSLVEPKERSGIVIQLSPGYAVRGVLQDNNGQMLGKTEVCFSGGRGTRTTTDERGQFSFAHVAPGKHPLWIYREGLKLQDSLVDFVMPQSNFFDLVLTVDRPGEEGGHVAGTVVDASGKPLADQRVLARSSRSTPSGKFWQGETRTDALGHFRIDGLGDSTHCMVDVYPDQKVWARVDDAPINSEKIELVALDFTKVTGRVLDANTGAPVREYKIRHIQYRPREFGEDQHQSEWLSVHSDTGEFRLDEVPPPAVRVEVLASGYAPLQSERLELAGTKGIEDLVLKLTPGAAIRGRILDERTRQPIPGARIRAYAPAYFMSYLLSDDPGNTFPNSGTTLLCVADEDGNFLLDPLKPGETVGLVAWAKGYGTQILTPSTPEQAGELQVLLQPEGKLRVTLENEALIEDDVLVWCAAHDAQAGANSFATAAGREWDGLAAGAYKVTLKTRPGKLLGIVDAEVVSGETTEVHLDLAQLQAQFGSVQGQVLPQLPEPVATVEVYAADATGAYVTQVSCEDGGAFLLTGLPPGGYSLIARRYGEPYMETAPVTVIVEAGQEAPAELMLEPKPLKAPASE